MRKRWYTVYDGDEVVASGTARECAEKLGVKVGTLRIITAKSTTARIAERKS